MYDTHGDLYSGRVRVPAGCSAVSDVCGLSDSIFIQGFVIDMESDC